MHTAPDSTITGHPNAPSGVPDVIDHGKLPAIVTRQNAIDLAKTLA
jgi:hypothetical protein